MGKMNSFIERLGIAFVVVLCVFSSWIFFSKAWDLEPDFEGPGETTFVYYFSNSVSTDPEDVLNYWYEEAMETQASRLPDFATDEVHIMRNAQVDGNITLAGVSTNGGIINGDAIFLGDQSENLGSVTGTMTRVYTTSTTTTRDFTENGTSWTVIASNGATVNVVGAVHDANTEFIREGSGRFVSNISLDSAVANENKLTLTFDTVLDETSIPDVSDFAVTISEVSDEVSKVEMDGTDVILTMSSVAPSDSTVYVSYTFGDTLISSVNGLNISEIENFKAEVQTTPVVNEVAENVNNPLNINNGSSVILLLPQTKLRPSEKNIEEEKTSSSSKDESDADINEKFSSSTSIPESPVIKETPQDDTKVATALQSKLLLAVEDKGTVWYVAPNQTVRYEVSTNNSLNLFRNVSLGITNKNLNQIPVVGTSNPVTPLSQRLVGRFLLQVESRGETWFVDQAGYKHRVTSENILDVTTKAVVGINNKTLQKIPTASPVK